MQKIFLGYSPSQKIFYSKVEESATFVHFFMTYNAEPDITPIVFAVPPSVKNYKKIERQHVITSNLAF